MNEYGTLSLIATPIGNLEDITMRSVRKLLEVDGIVCEDTRKTGMLLKKVREYARMLQLDSARKNDTPVRLLSYHEHNEARRIPEIINALKNGLNIAVVSDAGTPGVSDPGFRLVRACVAEGIPVESLPGPTSVITALVVSGLPTDKFTFLGYPPHKGGKRKQLYEAVKQAEQYVKSTIILFEAPHKLKKTLDELLETFGDIDIVITRELTKLHEEVRREKLSESITHFNKVTPKGEFVLLFHLDQS